MALGKRMPETHVRLWSRKASAARAKVLFPAVTSDPVEAVRGAELVVLCVPIDVMPDLARQMLPGLSPDCVVTDAGSVKATVCASLHGILGNRFIGAHPMAGSEHSGLEAARPELFDAAVCILTPSSTQLAGSEHLRVRAFWQAVGCRTLDLGAAEHDRLVARSSHLPHAVASVLAHAIGTKTPDALAVAGSGFRDTTRIASGPAAMWTGIFSANQAELLEALNQFKASLAEFEAAVRSGGPGVEAFLRKARESREGISNE